MTSEDADAQDDVRSAGSFGEFVTERAVMPVVLVVVGTDGAHGLARAAICHGVFRYVMGDQRVRPHHAIVADAHPGHHGHAGTKPHVPANMNRQGILRRFEPQVWSNRVACRHEGDIRAEHGMIPDENLTVIDKREVKIRVAVRPPVGVASPVRIHGAFEEQLVTNLGEKFLLEFAAPGTLAQRRGIQGILDFSEAGLQLKERTNLARQIHLARQHGAKGLALAVNV